MTVGAPSAVRSCRAAGLHRSPTDGSWTDDAGAPVTDPATLDRVRRLAIPPAWTDVWATPDATARVQATGIDARGRTQYRYSEAASAEAARHKFGVALDFGATLPALRAHVSRTLEARGGDAVSHRVRRTTAAVVRLVDKGLFRIGSDRYARDNHTYGLTTLTRRHVAVSGSAIEFTFTGKEHRPWHVIVDDRDVSEVVAELLAGPGDPASPLFTVTGGAAGERGRHDVTSAVVNAFIHGATTAPATAKTFRTWGGTAAAAIVASKASRIVAPRSRRPDLVALDVAADLLGNTREVARRSYVHPLAFEAARSPVFQAAVGKAVAATGTSDVRTLLHVDTVVHALAAELKRLADSTPTTACSSVRSSA